MLTGSESKRSSRRARFAIVLAVGIFVLGSFTTTLWDVGALGLKAAFTGRAFVEFDGVSRVACAGVPGAEGRCMVAGDSLSSDVKQIAAWTEDVPKAALLIREETFDLEGNVEVGRQVAFFGDPTNGTLAERGREVFKSVTEWAAGPKRGGSWRVLLVLPGESSDEEIEQAHSAVSSILGSRWQLAATATGFDSSESWDLLLLDAPVEIPESTPFGPAARIPVVVWSTSLWVEYEFVESAALREPDRLTVLDSSHPTVVGMFGGQPTAFGDQPTAEVDIASSLWASVLVAIGVVLVALLGRYALGQAIRAVNSPLPIDVLPPVVGDGYSDRVERNNQWNDTFRWVAVGIVVLAVVAALSGMWVLGIAEETGRDPEMSAGVRSVLSSSAWMSLSLLLALGGRLVAAWRHLTVHKRVEAEARALATSGQRDPGNEEAEDARPEAATGSVLGMDETANGTIEGPDAVTSKPPVDGVGVALSGGGIRAAAFGLGALETLQQLDDFDQVKYLSAVSGGHTRRPPTRRYVGLMVWYVSRMGLTRPRYDICETTPTISHPVLYGRHARLASG